MSGFSASDAALEGFQVLRRHWRVVAGWAAFNLLAMICLVVMTVIVAFVTAALVGSGADASNLSSMLGGVTGAVGAFMVWTIMMGGLYRLMMRPNEPAFLYLRLGADEMRLLALALILLIGLVVLSTGAGVAGRSAQPFAGWAPVVIDLAATVAGVWLALRLAVAGPATFARQRFDLGSAWKLTRGHVPALLGMLLLVLCVCAMIAVVGWLLLFTVMGVTTGFGGLMEVLS